MAALEERHLADLTFPQVAGALRALSSTYVERRGKLADGGALDGAGKRAAFALFYGPLHYLLVRSIVGSLPPALQGGAVPPTVVDLGCGTGAAGAAWAVSCSTVPRVVGIDRHQWAVGEAARTYREFGVTARTTQDDVARAKWPRAPVSIVAAFTLNELSETAREAVLARAVDRVANRDGKRNGDRLLVIEPLAGFVAPWWAKWRALIEAAGGRADEWRFRIELPAIVAKLDRASGLNHRELTGRSLWLA
jgi:methyltransferase family protein